MASSPLLIYLDDKLVPESEAKVSVFDHGLLYGDGCFEGIRIYNGRVFRLTEHLVRLYESARSICLTIPISIEEMEKATVETVAANNLRDGYIRLVITRGVGSLGLNPYQCPKAGIIIIASGITLYPKEKYETGLNLITCATRRPPPAALSPQVKSLNYLNNIMAKIECIQAGCEEGIMLNEQGYVAECTGDNIFVIKGGQVYTPTIASGALNGITRQAVMDVMREMGLQVHEVTMTRHEVYTADECFLTGTAAEVIPAVQYDRRPIGDGKPGKLTAQIITKFKELANSSGTEVYSTRD
ncbi:branched-chain amino acid aminotransferase [Prosthecobacter fusiformis]|uniref:Branched-chain-amino-acid aminotransferase n=1 Tax=Prosthecobacter fusiformis TaxID=48464 RepID=A0A4R7S718_9BACT|nr:branched-chain-amino-acid transaminase [Prosthecobacter fusiformis]TDU73007.1 branched-chain amino acid aminotransferase [Prosthecobacter fusiformis]